MSDINNLLSEFWKGDTTKVAAAQAEFAQRDEQVASQAQAELFMKMAAAENIDVDALLKAGQTDVVDQLWSNFQGLIQKQASDESDEHKKVEEKAKEEHEEKKGMAEKLALADLQGRVMAHSYVNELGNIAGNGEVNKTAASLATGGNGEVQEKTALSVGLMAKAKAERLKRTVSGAGEKAKEHGSAALSRIGDAFKGTRAREAHEALQHKGRAAAHVSHLKGERLKGVRESAAAYGGSALALGGAAKGVHHVATRDKESSAIDQLAAEAAVMKVASWVESLGGTPDQIVASVEEAAEKIAAADTLNMFDEGSVKVAAAPDWETAVDWRACEMLERVGYPINWPEA